MRCHIIAGLAAVAVVMPLCLASAEQAPAAKGGDKPRASSKTPGGTTASKAWTMPRTPCGDPDLQGLWPSIDMQGTPYERPPELAGRTVLNDEEFSARETTRQQQAEADAERYVVNRPRRGGGTGPPSHWGEHGTPSRQASLVVEPADGRLPPLTEEGRQRIAKARSTYYYDFPDAVVAHPFDNFQDLGPYDRCITRGLLASMLPTGYNMGNEIFQIPGFVVIRNEMIHETRSIPLDGRSHLGPRIRQYMGDSRGHWLCRSRGTPTPGCSNTPATRATMECGTS